MYHPTIWRHNFNYLVYKCTTFDIAGNVLISYEIQHNYDLLKEMTAQFVSLSGKIQSDEMIMEALFLFMKKIMLSHTGQLMTVAHDSNTIPWSNSVIKIISHNHFPKANAEIFPTF